MGIIGLIKDHRGELFKLQINWDWDGCWSQYPRPCWKGQRGLLFRNSEHGRGKEFNGWLFSKFSTTNVVAWSKLRRIFWWRPISTDQNLDSLGKSGARSLFPSLANDISFLLSQWIFVNYIPYFLWQRNVLGRTFVRHPNNTHPFFFRDVLFRFHASDISSTTQLYTYKRRRNRPKTHEYGILWIVVKH